MLLPRPIHIEVAQADCRRRHLVQSQPVAKVVVEGQLGKAIDVQRSLVLQRRRKVSRPGEPVDRRAGGKDQRDALLHGKPQHLFRVLEVVVHHVHAVVFKRVGAGALVQNRLDPTFSQCIFSNGAAKLPLVHVIHIARAVQVLELPGIGQVVHHQNVRDAVRIQLVDQVAADKARASSND